MNRTTTNAAVDKQRESTGGRDGLGRFTKDAPTAFKPGQSGNPAGRPKSITLSEAFRRQLSQPVLNDPHGRTYAELIAARVCVAAANGDVAAAREIADRTEGKPKQAIDVDMSVSDWRQVAAAHGLNEQDVLREAKRLIESAIDPSGE
jgi:hypothetical protein